MIKIHLNNRLISLTETCSLHQLVNEEFIASDVQKAVNAYALVLNGEIVPRQRWSSIHCQNSDVIELFAAVAGG